MIKRLLIILALVFTLNKAYPVTHSFATGAGYGFQWVGGGKHSALLSGNIEHRWGQLALIHSLIVNFTPSQRYDNFGSSFRYLFGGRFYFGNYFYYDMQIGLLTGSSQDKGNPRKNFILLDGFSAIGFRIPINTHQAVLMSLGFSMPNTSNFLSSISNIVQLQWQYSL